MNIEAVVFDIGRVLIEYDPRGWFAQQIGADRAERLFAEVPLEAANEDVDAGADFTETFYGLAETHPEWAAEARMFHDRWLEFAAPEIPHSVRLLRALKAKGVPVLALSNFGVGTWQIAKPKYPFFAEFDQAYVSGFLKEVKPFAGIYEILESRSGFAPSSLLFTDDKPENIAAAEIRGWQTHLFEGPQGLADRLVAAGLLTAEEAR